MPNWLTDDLITPEMCRRELVRLVHAYEILYTSPTRTQQEWNNLIEMEIPKDFFLCFYYAGSRFYLQLSEKITRGSFDDLSRQFISPIAWTMVIPRIDPVVLLYWSA